MLTSPSLWQTLGAARCSRFAARLTPWFVIDWLGKLEIWCWADLVGWKLRDGCAIHRLHTCLETDVFEGEARCQCWCGYWDRVNRVNAARILRADAARGRCDAQRRTP